MKHLVLATSVLAAAGVLLAAKIDTTKLPPPSTQKGVTFAKDIKPLFEKSCVKCHGPEKQKGKLRLDSLADVLKGSENGKCFEVGKSDKSILVALVSCLDPKEFMPPEGKGDPLTKEQVGLIRAWIDQGAK